MGEPKVLVEIKLDSMMALIELGVERLIKTNMRAYLYLVSNGDMEATGSGITDMGLRERMIQLGRQEQEWVRAQSLMLTEENNEIQATT